MLWFGSALCCRRLKKTGLFPLLMELMRGVCFSQSISRSSSRLSPRARHSSTSDDVVAVNRSDILDRTTTITTTERERPTCGVDEEEGQDENENEKRMKRWNDFGDRKGDDPEVIKGEWMMMIEEEGMGSMMIEEEG